MATAGTHPELERVRTCATCQAPFVERTNMGRFACRTHPDRSLTREGRYACCGYPLHDMGFASEPRDGAVYTGCLPCDHAETLTTERTPPMATAFPRVYVQRGIVDAPPPATVLALVTPETLHEILANRHPRVLQVAVPAPLTRLELDLVATAFQILLNFVASDYWHMRHVPEFAAQRARVEAVMRDALVADDWDPARDTRDASLMRIASEDAREVLDDETQDAQYAQPTPGTFDLLAARVAFVRLARGRGDTRALARCMVPYMVIRRVAAQKWPATLANIQAYSDRTSATRTGAWHPVQRHEL